MAIDKVVDSGLLDAGLTSIADKIRSRSNGTSQLAFPDGFTAEIDRIPVGTSSYKLLASRDFFSNTTSASQSKLGVITCNVEDFNASTIIYIRIRDKAGKRNGYFYGCDTFIYNKYQSLSFGQTISVGCVFVMSVENDSTAVLQYGTSSGYGVYAYSIDSNGQVTIRHRYSSGSSKTIDGTYKCEVFALNWPDGISPFIE